MNVNPKAPRGASERPTARGRILAAAADLARELGPANIALDAVAARAGVSKGGLLYHFPAKTDLMEALVEDHLEKLRDELSAHEQAAQPGGNALRSYLEVSLADCREEVASTGVLAAIVQHPEMLKPIKRFKRQTLDRLKAEAGSDVVALVVFLALEGLRSAKLFDSNVLSDAETEMVASALRQMTSQPKAAVVGKSSTESPRRS